ncbi:tryptophan 2,3-dioxygenase family protein [Streptomyces sp. NPDC056656]|uniref:tryptophan 2,3-dioxygenase family protein n=1 Tax=Streptomyces sp. NPDC056656 TaxID=3345895 RepID=UPI003673FE4A
MSSPDAPHTPCARYLRLTELLSLQHPRTGDTDSAQWADERFFITVHQSAEVLAGQAIADLHQAARGTDDGTTVGVVRRVGAILAVLEEHLAPLDQLDAERFARFRPLLEDASGGQSYQFAALFTRIETPHCAVRPPDAAVSGELAGAPAGLRAAVIRWRVRHLLLVERMIGDSPDTDGTEGLAYLRSLIVLPPRGQVS